MITLEQEIEEILYELLASGLDGAGDTGTIKIYAERIANLAREVLDVQK